MKKPRTINEKSFKTNTWYRGSETAMHLREFCICGTMMYVRNTIPGSSGQGAWTVVRYSWVDNTLHIETREIGLVRMSTVKEII